MNALNLVVALITLENDYQAEQAASAISAAARVGAKLQVIYADNDAVNQTQQIVKLIQDPIRRPTAILVEPVGTGMIQVAKAAVAAGIGWGVLNREPEYLSELRRDRRAPAFCVTVDQEEVGRIQGRQMAALVREGNVLQIEGPSNSSVVTLRTKGLLATKPPQITVKTVRGAWTERSGQLAVKSWLSLSTSRQLRVQAVISQNDAMAMGARKALLDLTEKDREVWQDVPFTGCDGVTRTGQDWVRRGLLSATVITPATAGTAVEVLVQAARDGSEPPQRTQISPISFPPIRELTPKSRWTEEHSEGTGLHAPAPLLKH
jgi:ABC-type sugar transport system substrate-binding protein